MNRIAPAIALAALAAALPAHGQVYKCTVGGTTTYSAQPCGASAQALDVRPASGASRQAPAAEPAASASTPAGPSVASRGMTQRADDAARRRILDDDIWRKQRAIDAMHDEHSTRQAQLRAKKTRANNNLAGATWEQSISDEMQAVAAEYDMKLRKATKELDELKMQRSQIP